VGQLLGRKVTLGAIEFAPWSLELTVRELSVAKADGSGPQFSVERVYVDAELQSLLRLAPVVDAIAVESPRVYLTHEGDGRYDIDDLVQKLHTPDETPAGATPRFALYNLTLQGGSVDYTDRAGTKTQVHTLRDLQVSVPFVSSFDSQREVLVAPRLAFVLNGSRFDSAAQATPFAPNRKTDAEFTIRDFDLAPYLPYVPAGLPVKPVSGVVDAQLRLGFVQSPAATVRLEGSVSLTRFAANDASGQPLISADRLELALADVRPLERMAKLSGITLTAPELHVRRTAAGKLNLELESSGKNAPKNIAKDAEKTAAEGTKDRKEVVAGDPWTVQVDTLSLQQARVNWTDAQTQPVTRWAMQELDATLSGLQWPMKDAARLALEGRLQGLSGAAARLPATRIRVEGEGTPEAGTLQTQVAAFGLGLVEGYVAPYLVPAVKGQLDAQMQARWEAGRPRIDIQQLALRDVALTAAPAAAGSVRADRASAGASASAPAEGRISSGSNGVSSGDLPQFKLLEVSDVQIDPTARTATVGRVLLRKPSSGVRRDSEGRWMYEAWLKNPVAGDAASPVPATTPTSAALPSPQSKGASPWKTLVLDFRLEDANVTFFDRLPARPVRLEFSGVQLSGKNIQPDGKKPVPVQLQAKVRSGQAEAGGLRYSGSLMWDPLVAQGEVEMLDLPAHVAMSYAGGNLRMDVLRADTSFKGQVRFASLPAGPELSLKGDAALDDFKANTYGKGADSLGEELLSWKALSVPGVEVALAPGAPARVQVREASLSDFYARLIVSPQGRLNLQEVAGAPESAAETATAPAVSAPVSAPASAPASPANGLAPVILVGPVSLVNGRVLFSDRFIQPNYTANLTDLTGKLSRFSNQATDGAVQLADLELRGRAEGTASLEIRGKLNPLAQPLALDITGLVRDLELSPLSPYAVKYAGYGIERGKLSVDVRYAVQPNGQLTAENKLVLNQLTFGDKVEGAPASLPVKLAVALLADRNGVIDLNLPISGSLNDPQFRIGPVVWKVITNLIAKAVTAPFSLLANAFGGGAGSDLGNVAFAPGSAALTTDARQGLDKVVKALMDRPSLKLTVLGYAHLESEREAAKRDKLKALLLAEKRRIASGQGKDLASVGAVTEDEVPTLLRAVYRRADIAKPRNMVGLTKELSVTEMEALLLANLNVKEQDIRDLAMQRAVVVKDYLAAQKLPADRLFLGSVKTAGNAADIKPQAELQITGD
jgi:uncharacterized protein involved in outer membrane biogenesis